VRRGLLECPPATAPSRRYRAGNRSPALTRQAAGVVEHQARVARSGVDECLRHVDALRAQLVKNQIAPWVGSDAPTQAAQCPNRVTPIATFDSAPPIPSDARNECLRRPTVSGE